MGEKVQLGNFLVFGFDLISQVLHLKQLVSCRVGFERLCEVNAFLLVLEAVSPTAHDFSKSVKNYDDDL